jgi:transketolase
MQNKELIKKLEKKAKEMRIEIIKMTTKAAAGHPTSSMSAIDIVVALYYNSMKFDPKKPNWPDRDRFILSKGHACPAQYAVLGDTGYFDKKEFLKLRQINSMLQGHPDRMKIPGIEVSSGSLGQGLSVGNGMAWAGKMDNKDYRVYVMLGDGEMQEGQVWESVMTTCQWKLDNVTAFVDCNGLQNDWWVKEEKDLGSLAEKFKAFGWNTIEIDGHNMEQILDAIEAAKKNKGKPTAIIAKTVKGKGVGFIENDPDRHGVALTEEEMKRALKELGAE